jgi:conjugal transfer pilus assembly protein TraK
MKNVVIAGAMVFTYSLASVAADESIYDLPTEPVADERQIITTSEQQKPNKNAGHDATLAAMDRAMEASGIDISQAGDLSLVDSNGVPIVGRNNEQQVQPQSTPIDINQSVAAAGILSGRDDSMDKIRKKYKSHQVVNIQAGRTELLPISSGMTNRIWTNFNKVKATTSVPKDAALIHSDGAFIYVVPGMGVNSIDLILEEEGAPETAINLTLIPLDVPPVMVELKVSMNSNQKTARNEAIIKREKDDVLELEKAKQAERERLFLQHKKAGADEHVNSIMTLLEKVALADIPAGYELLEMEEIEPTSRFPCQIDLVLPLYHEVKQQLVGARTVIDIVEIRNDVNGLRTFREEACMGIDKEDVIAVAVLDRATLAPGESAEVYIVRDRFYYERKNRQPKRKRVVN